MSPGTFHFRAALDLLGQDWGGPPGHAQGAWDAMVRRVRRAGGTSIISHEILAPARAGADRRALKRARRRRRDRDPRRLLRARPRAARLPAAWQESVKQGRRWKYGRYLTKVREGRSWFARAFDLPTVLSTLGQRTAARARPRRDRAARRARPTQTPTCCGAASAARSASSPTWAPRRQRAHQHLAGQRRDAGAPLAQRAASGAHTRENPGYDALILGMLADETLGSRRSRPILLPPKFHDWARERGESWVEWLEQSGVDVVGDPAELVPEPPSRGAEVQAPRPRLRQGAARGRPRRAGRDDRGGGLAPRPRRLDARSPQARRARPTAGDPDGVEDADREHEARAWGWVAHLRDGGTTPWSAWGSRAGADEQSGRYLPGAQQLELLRRLNLPPPAVPRARRAGAGRECPGPRAGPTSGSSACSRSRRFGPPPVDPGELPADELRPGRHRPDRRGRRRRRRPARAARDRGCSAGATACVGDPEVADVAARRPGRRRPAAGRPSADRRRRRHGPRRRCSSTSGRHGRWARASAPWPEWLAAELRRGRLAGAHRPRRARREVGPPGRREPGARRARRSAPRAPADRPPAARSTGRDPCRPTRSSWPAGRLRWSAAWSRPNAAAR